MIADIPSELVLVAVAAFALGWILSAISAALGARYKARKRDPRDDRIRSMDAELRIARSDLEATREKLAVSEEALMAATEDIEKRDNVISHQQSRVDKLKQDLKESVIKTRELRHELTDRAEENVRSEVKLREVETELSVAQASTDLIATGVLDYSLENEEGRSADNESGAFAAADVPKSAG